MTLQDSVLKTLKYSDHFGFPLTATEIHLRLISSEPCLRRQACSLERVFKTLQLMLKNKIIYQTQDYYHLPGKKSLVAKRLNHQKASKSQLARVKKLSQLLSHTPFVKAIYLTGSLAMSNSQTDSDIDFMIITKEGKLWTTRFILTLFTNLMGLRRTPGSSDTAGKLCLNLYLTPYSYQLPSHKRSVYTAYELIQAVPLYDPEDTRTDLLASNSWIKAFLGNVPLPAKPVTPHVLRKTGFLESLFFNLQYFYMKPKLTREYITINSAFFHPHDPSPQGL